MNKNTIYKELEPKIIPGKTTLDQGMEIFSNICEDRINTLRFEIKEASVLFKERCENE